MNLHHPIIMDNKNLRKENPSIQAHFDECERELEGFPRVNGIIQDKNLVDWISCPVCGYEESQQWMVKWGGRYDECPKCTHIFSKNRLKISILDELYKKSLADHYDREVQKHSFNFKYWTAIYNKYLSYLWENYTKKASILDVGAGSGQFIRYCHKNGATNLHALDVYPTFPDQLNDILPSNHLHVVDSFETSVIGKTFDMIFLWGVLEHLCDPNKVLSKCADYLNREGKVFVLIPNIHSRAKQILGVMTPTINPRQHINFFTSKSMEIVARQNGFKISHILQELPVIDLMWPYIEHTETLLSEIYEKQECYFYVFMLEKEF